MRYSQYERKTQHTNSCFRKGLKMIVLLLAAAGLFSFGQAACAGSFTKKKALKTYGEMMSYNGSNWSFAVIYLNNDTIPELIVTESPDGPGRAKYLYTCKKGRIISIENPGNDNGEIFTRYYKKKGILPGYFAHANRYEYNEETNYYKWKGSSLKNMMTVDRSDSSYSYSNANGRKITKAAFRKKLKKLTGGRKSTKIRYYTNTAANRRKVLKYS